MMFPLIERSHWSCRELMLYSLIGSGGGLVIALAVMAPPTQQAALATAVALGIISGVSIYFQRVLLIQRINTLGHDIRGPLTRLLLRADELSEPEQHEVNVIPGLKADLRILIELTEELERIGRARNQSTGREWVRLSSCFQHITASYPPTNVRVHVDSACSARVDRRRLERTLHNLIENALEYGGPPVLLQARIYSGRLELSVEDSGASQLTSQPISRPFAHLHKGLGWANARSFCHSHGGDMTIGSSRLGGLQVNLSLSVETRVEESQ